MKWLYCQLIAVVSFASLLAPGDTHASSALSPVMPPNTSHYWFNNGQPTANTLVALDTLLDAASQGLDPKDYGASALASRIQDAALLRTLASAPALDELSANINKALVAYVRDLNQGRLSPAVLKYQFKAPARSTFDAQAYVDNALSTNTLAKALEQAQPDAPLYDSLRKAMNDYRQLGHPVAWEHPLPSPTGPSLKPGQEYPALGVLAERLIILGDLPKEHTTPMLYEGSVVEGVKKFQERHGLSPDGVIGRETLAQLNVSPAQRVQQIALSLERLRWTPLRYGQRMIVINIPEFTLRAYRVNPDRSVAVDVEMRVIVGRALNTRTPIFLEDMRFIEFSPYWNIPISIARAETLPKLRRDPAYFNRQGLEFVTKEGKVVTTLTEAGIEAVQRGEWRIRQRPGPLNALGDIKFIFPNDQNIYLHHTPAQNLFGRVRRDLSHGCIRVEEPVKLAEFVLNNHPDWPRSRIVEAMEGGKSRTLKLNEPLPVLIAYSTAMIKNDKVHFFPDIYQQDARLEIALKSR